MAFESLHPGRVAALRARLAPTVDALLAHVRSSPAPGGDAAARTASAPAFDDEDFTALCAAFSLDDIESKILSVLLAFELDLEVERALSSAHPPWDRAAVPLVHLARWPGAEARERLRDDLPLLRDGLVMWTDDLPWHRRGVRMNGRVLRFLLGDRDLDDELASSLRPIAVPWSSFAASPRLLDMLPPAARAADTLRVNLCGDQLAALRSAAFEIAAGRMLRPLWLQVDACPAADARAAWRTQVRRELRLLDGVLVVDLHATEGAAVRELLDDPGVPVLALTRSNARVLPESPCVEVAPLSSGDVRDALSVALPLALPRDTLDALTTEFRLDATALEEVVRGLGIDQDPTRPAAERAWDLCRQQSRARMEAFAQRLEVAAAWDDLVLPAASSQALRELCAHVRQRHKVHHTWSMGHRGGRGLGVSALFSGPSGTGKTTAAEAIAHELRMDLHRVDLSATVSKYIGETEKNLRRVFDAAEGGGVVLLFDEADALFGKRSEVKDSHDRYANLEVSYLLQRIETFRGLAILTTNLRGHLDTAFLRRLRFVVDFPFPDATQREALWRKAFPPQVPTEGVDHRALARLQITGGTIRNMALHAAFLAADAGEPVRMRHLLAGALREYEKLERPLTQTEMQWFGA